MRSLILSAVLAACLGAAALGYGYTGAAAAWSLPGAVTGQLGSVGGLPRLTPTGTPPPLTYVVLDEAGRLAPSEVVNGSLVLLASRPGTYRVLAWPTGGGDAQQSVITLLAAADAAPGPGPLPSGPTAAVPYPDLAAAVAAAFEGAASPARARADARTLAILYSYEAAKIALDGTRSKPFLTTISGLQALLKSEEAAFLGDSALAPPRTSYPGISAAAGAKFVELFGDSPASRPTGDTLTPEARALYVDLLRSIAAGARKAAQP